MRDFKKVKALFKDKRVAVLKGGWSRERAVSLRSGKAVEQSLKRLGIPFVGIDVKPHFQKQLKKKKINFCFIALHGTFGEDGQIQRILKRMKIGFTGSNAMASSLAMDKHRSKLVFRNSGLPTPRWIRIAYRQFKKNPKKITRQIGSLLKKSPVFIKPADQGSAIGAKKVSTIKDIKTALDYCFQSSKWALVEEFIPGRELTVGVLGKRAFPVVEIIPKHSFYDYHSKYAKGGSRHVVPAKLSSKLSKSIQRSALKAFRVLGCSVVGRIDFLLRPDQKFFILEVNTIPGLTSTSLLPDGAKAIGMNFENLVGQIMILSVHQQTQTR